MAAEVALVSFDKMEVLAGCPSRDQHLTALNHYPGLMYSQMDIVQIRVVIVNDCGQHNLSCILFLRMFHSAMIAVSSKRLLVRAAEKILREPSLLYLADPLFCWTQHPTCGSCMANPTVSMSALHPVEIVVTVATHIGYEVYIVYKVSFCPARLDLDLGLSILAKLVGSIATDIVRSVPHPLPDCWWHCTALPG